MWRISLTPKDDSDWFRLVCAYSFLVLIVLSANISEGAYINDEITYALAVHSLSRGSFAVENGPTDIDSKELVLHSMANLRGMLYSQYPPIYTIIAVPFYQVFGIWGLFVMNILSYSAAIVLVYLISMQYFRRGGVSAFAAVFYSLSAYSMKYAIEIWPHMLSVSLVLAAYYLAIRKMNLTSGFMMGVCVGVRYSNLLLAAVLCYYIITRKNWAGTLRFAAGISIPLAVILLLNMSFSGSFREIAYTSESGRANLFRPLEFTAYPLILAVFGVAAYMVAKLKWDERKSALSAAASVIVLALVVVVFDGSFSQNITKSAMVAYSEVFDMQVNPSLVKVTTKKSLLQASPILALSVFGAAIMRRKEDYAILFWGPIVAFIIFYSCFYNMHGGLTPFMRYFLEAIPFLSILTVVALSQKWGKKLDEKDIAYFTNFIIVFTISWIISTSYESLNQIHLRAIPLALAAALIFSRKPGTLFTIAVIAAAAYGASTNLADTTYTKSIREYNRIVLEEFDFIKDGSTLFYGYYWHFNDIGMLKIMRNITLVDTKADNMTDAPEILKHYVDAGTPTYIMQYDEPDYLKFIESSRKQYNSEIIYREHADFYRIF